MTAPLGSPGSRNPITPSETARGTVKKVDQQTAPAGKGLGKTWKFFISEMKSAWSWIKASSLFRSIFGSSKSNQSHSPFPLNPNRVSVLTAETTASGSVAATSETALHKLGITSNPPTKEELERAKDDCVYKLNLCEEKLEAAKVFRSDVSALKEEIKRKELEYASVEASIAQSDKVNVPTGLIDALQVQKNKIKSELSNLQEKLKLNLQDSRMSDTAEEMVERYQAQLIEITKLLAELEAKKTKLEPPLAKISEGSVETGTKEVNAAKIAEISPETPTIEERVNKKSEPVAAQTLPSSLERAQVKAEKANVILSNIKQQIPVLREKQNVLTSGRNEKKTKLEDLRSQISKKRERIASSELRLADYRERGARIDSRNAQINQAKEEQKALNLKSRSLIDMLKSSNQRISILTVSLGQASADKKPAILRLLAEAEVLKGKFESDGKDLIARGAQQDELIRKAKAEIEDTTKNLELISRDLSSEKQELEILLRSERQTELELAQISNEITETSQLLAQLESNLPNARTEFHNAKVDFEIAQRKAAREIEREKELEGERITLSNVTEESAPAPEELLASNAPSPVINDIPPDEVKTQEEPVPSNEPQKPEEPKTPRESARVRFEEAENAFNKIQQLISQLQAQQKALTTSKNELERRVNTLQRQKDDANNRLSASRKKLADDVEQQAQIQWEISEENLKKSVVQAQLTQNRERIVVLDTSLRQIDSQIKLLKLELPKLREGQSKAKAISTQLEVAGGIRAKLLEERNALTTKNNELGVVFKDARKLYEAQARKEEIEADMRRFSSAMTLDRSEYERLTHDHAEALAKLANVNTQINDSSVQLQKLETALPGARKERDV